MSEQAICTDWAELYFSAIFLHGYCTCMLLACLGWDLQKGADLFRSTPTEDRSLLSLVRAEFGKSGKNCLSFQKIQSFPCTRTWNSYVTGFLRYFFLLKELPEVRTGHWASTVEGFSWHWFTDFPLCSNKMPWQPCLFGSGSRSGPSSYLAPRSYSLMTSDRKSIWHHLLRSKIRPCQAGYNVFVLRQRELVRTETTHPQTKQKPQAFLCFNHLASSGGFSVQCSNLLFSL